MILAAGLTPAWQQAMRFDHFTLGEVNRAFAVERCASGKVLNVAHALASLNCKLMTLALVGGPTAEWIEADFAASGIPRQWVLTSEPTRVCTTILTSDGRSSELVENAPAATCEELAAFERAYAALAGKAEIAILTGSLPAGARADYYRDLARHGPAKLILDIRGPELLYALELRPWMVKPNRHELAQTVGHALADDAALAAAIDEIRQRGAEWVVVTDGAGLVHTVGPRGRWQIAAPRAAAVNPIGAGDCLAAGIAAAVADGRTPIEAVRWGVAVAAASVETVLPGRFSPARAKELAESMV